MIDSEQLDSPRAINGPSRSRTSRISRYGPLALWAILIFIGSGNLLSAAHTSILLHFIKWLYPSASPEFLSLVHFLVRKAGHLTEYAILAVLAQRAFRNSSHQFLRRNWFWLSLLSVVGYALSDEFHQSFVPSRTASIYDCMIDTVGGFLGLAIVWWRSRQIRRKESNVLNDLKQAPQLDFNR